jgi:hypothetical protein
MNISDAIVNTYGAEQLRVLKTMPFDEAKKAIRLLMKRDCPNYTNKWGSLAHITHAVLKKI